MGGTGLRRKSKFCFRCKFEMHIRYEWKSYRASSWLYYTQIQVQGSNLICL